MTPTNITEQLLRDIGLRLLPATDSAGHILLGVGRNLSTSGITVAEAMMLLENDQKRAERHLRAAWPWTDGLNEPRRAALVGLIFVPSMGIEGLLGSRRLMAAVKSGEYELAAREILDSARARRSEALAERLAEQMQSGQWV